MTVPVKGNACVLYGCFERPIGGGGKGVCFESWMLDRNACMVRHLCGRIIGDEAMEVVAGRMHVDGTIRLGWNSKVQTYEENFVVPATGKVERRGAGGSFCYY